MKTLKKTILLTLVFSIAMGMLEAIVVVYLRQIYYPSGFKFPLEVIPDSILSVEALRELCTLVILVSIAVIAGKNKLQSFSYFLFCFAVWDITYYTGLKLILNWPASFFTWDILFLVPFPWIGPVAAPIISSLSMIILSLTLLFIQKRFESFKVKIIEWLMIYFGAVLIFISFIWDYISLLVSKNLITKIFSADKSRLENLTFNYVPGYFNWGIFILGIFVIYLVIYLIVKRYILFKKMS